MKSNPSINFKILHQFISSQKASNKILREEINGLKARVEKLEASKQDH